MLGAHSSIVHTYRTVFDDPDAVCRRLRVVVWSPSGYFLRHRSFCSVSPPHQPGDAPALLLLLLLGCLNINSAKPRVIKKHRCCPPRFTPSISTKVALVFLCAIVHSRYMPPLFLRKRIHRPFTIHLACCMLQAAWRRCEWRN